MTLTISLPGKFTDFLEGTSEITGNNGNTPLYLAYKEYSRYIRRGRGHTMEVSFPFADVEKVREALTVLREQAENCVYFNQDVMEDDQARAEVKAAKVVLQRVDELFKTLPEPTEVVEPVQEPVEAPVVQIWHKSAAEVIDGFTDVQKARLLLWFKDATDDMEIEHPGIFFEVDVAAMREIVRRDWNRVL